MACFLLTDDLWVLLCHPQVDLSPRDMRIRDAVKGGALAFLRLQEGSRSESLLPLGSHAFRVILLRHGESTWNRDGRYIGWTDVPLTEKGEREARQAGEALANTPYTAIDVVYTSYLKRAIKTSWLALQAMGLEHLPSVAAWQLNERMFGLAGLTEAEAIKKHGRDRVSHWARSWDQPPPEVEAGSAVDPRADVLKYGHLKEDQVPRTESMKMTQERAAAYWEAVIKEDLRSRRRAAAEEGQRGPTTAMIVSHSNCIKCLMSHMDGLKPAEMSGVLVPRAVPIIYDLDEEFRPLRRAAPSRPSGLFVYPESATASEIKGRVAANS